MAFALPMQWTADRNGGFSKADPLETVFAGHLGFRYGYQCHQCGSPAAIAPFSLALDEAHDRHAEEASGVWTGHGDVSASAKGQGPRLHSKKYRGETLLLVHNLAGSAQAVELDLARFKSAIPLELSANPDFRGSANGRTR